MKDLRLVGIDLAKNTFQVCLMDRHNRIIANKKIRRAKLLDFLRQLPPNVTIAMEACGTAHYWARELRKLGFSKIVLVPAQHVKPFVGKQKNDANDARAICEAAMRPDLHPVPVKTAEQQDIKALRSQRAQCIKTRNMMINHVRGHCAEYGVILPKGVSSFRKKVPEALENADNGLTAVMRELVAECYSEVLRLIDKEAELSKKIHGLCKTSEDYKNLQSVPGIGPLNAAAAISEIGDGSQFGKGRHYAAFIGLVPRQHSSGDRLLSTGITKSGDRQLRTLLVHSARTLVQYVDRKNDPLSLWVKTLIKRRGKNKAIVALANKLARICWAVLKYKKPYQVALACA